VDRSRRDELVDASGDEFGLDSPIDHLDLYLAAKNSAIGVQVVGDQLAHGLTRRPEDAAGALQGHHHGHPPHLGRGTSGVRVHNPYVLRFTVHESSSIVSI
jgi:hypothetical protein